MSSSLPIYSFTDLIELFSHHRRLWIVPTLLVTAVALIYSVVRQATWEASQALVVRNEAHASGQRPGKFAVPEEMKTVQETILELVKSDSVLKHALSQVGTSNSASTIAAPNDCDIAALRDAVKLSPPNGTEFGKTEMFYLRVKAEDRRRATA